MFIARPHDLNNSRILLNLRRAATPETKLLIADHVLPLACLDEVDDFKGESLPLPGLVPTLAPEDSHLLPNLGKANGLAYWLDLTVRKCLVFLQARAQLITVTRCAQCSTLRRGLSERLLRWLWQVDGKSWILCAKRVLFSATSPPYQLRFPQSHCPY